MIRYHSLCRIEARLLGMPYEHHLTSGDTEQAAPLPQGV
jgi:hypothetical protein